jgi:hypothetical protein
LTISNADRQPVLVGTLQDQQLVPQGKNLGLQVSASSEPTLGCEK